MAIGSHVLYPVVLAVLLIGCQNVDLRNRLTGVNALMASVEDDLERAVIISLLPAEINLSSSSIHLLEGGDGSIALRSAVPHDSLLRGLDPALVDPAVLPFLFPSCDVPVSSAR